MGRASKVKDYIKKGKKSAYTEITLYRNGKDPIVVKRSFKEAGDAQHTDWKINGKTHTSESVQNLMKKLNIQLENLTQFLPQDRVSHFASLGPVDLLKQTEEAVLEPRILELHKELTQMKNEFQTKHTKVDEYQRSIDTLKKKNETLEKDVERFKQRKKHEERVEQLQLKKPFIVFNELQLQGRKVNNLLCMLIILET